MLLLLFFYFTSFHTPTGSQTQNLRIGGLFQHETEQKAFHLATDLINAKYKDSSIRLIPDSHLIDNYNAYTTYLTTCELLQKGVIAIFGPSSIHSSPAIQTILDRKEIPHVETYFDRKLSRHDCLLNLHPHPSVMSQAYLEIVNKWGWRSLVVIYDSEESLAKLGLFAASCKQRVTLSRLELDMYDTFRTSLTSIKKTGETNFILECSVDILEAVLKQAQQVGMMTERHSYIITKLDLQTIDLAPFQYSEANITGFRIFNPENAEIMSLADQIYTQEKYKGIPSGWLLRHQTALLIDSVDLLHQAVLDLTLSEQVVIQSQTLYCNTSNNWDSGHTIVNYMKGQTIKGLTGVVHFDNEGFRRDFTLDILELSLGGLLRIGAWSFFSGLSLNRPPNLSKVKIVDDANLVNKTFTVITCLTTPYGMLKETTQQLFGNDRFEGFGIDLMDELSKMLGFNYTIIIQEDGYNGNYNQTTGEWNGLIGAILSGKADLAIADLTVTAEREAVVDFTLQFMNLGISILYKKPKPVPPSLFMFVSPFSYTVWILLVVTYFLVSMCFFVMGRLSPSEWTNPFPCVEEPEYLINQFSIRNSLWFTIGSLMQQGTELAPIGISTRTGAGVWWFFTLIMVSSYTANLAAFLTVETLVTPFSNVKELSEQTEIKYGAKRGGATANFFKNAGNDSVRSRIWHFMATHDEEMTESNDEGVERTEEKHYAFFMESTTIEYVIERHCSLASVGAPLDDKGYAIAMKKNSSYRNDLSAAILRLQETGKIAQLKEKWWKEKRGASNCGAQKSESAATPLNLQNVGGVFLVLFLGTGLGFCISFVELALRVYSTTKKTDQQFRKELIEEIKFFIRFKKNVKSVKPETH
ncbi:glutamate receptor ionotropic, kainate 2 [Tribolium castaneum]|uniref:Glutamate receptor 1-like Protein n=1 Tax=Tribolium castaneum TaxID=7070 RepID=A0A139WNG3_TRICA|nr:PREDICTED: glutamate receptor ionotropic, kainate 2-like [Tribolium castaneum]KYB29341.1 Glutamate receptor 1-like Protein [Tribolium castaneum]|eukprot:XP_008201661.1 PREDICTED: glutamate receptor ionotropic, kainate 2-like [Tribolium castaneum]